MDGAATYDNLREEGMETGDKRSPATSVEQALEALGADFQRVKGKTSRLIERIEPLLGPNRLSAAAMLKSDGEDRSTSTHVQALVVFSERLLELESQLDDALQRLEIS